MKEELPGTLSHSMTGGIFLGSDRSGLGSQGQGERRAASLCDVFFLPSLPCQLVCFLPCPALNVFNWSFVQSSKVEAKTSVPKSIHFCFSVRMDVIKISMRFD